MIAVVAKRADYVVVREFFELFKTPWRFYEEGCSHDVLLCSEPDVPRSPARLVVLCGRERRTDLVASVNEQRIVHFDFNLFAKVRELLTTGQPAENAAKPTLDLLVGRLRSLLLEHGVDVVEIPPVPSGYNFIACLTHDVDHARLRYHRRDPAILGFLYRATLGSLGDLRTGRKQLTQVLANWKAAFSLPFAYVGLAPDCWDQFQRFIELEDKAPSTFFFVSRSGDPGLDASGIERSKRAVKYKLSDVANDIAQLRAAGKEIGVHGIEAWRDTAKGREELAALEDFAPSEEVGVRMHWLFFDESSPAKLEAAGFSFDSTVGYNNTVGFRAGTSQAFKPLDCERLLELPLHIMDTALFFPSHMHLSAAQAEAAVAPLIEHAAAAGGALTVNWHDRSLGPERLWEKPYVELIDSLRAKGAWFATAGDAVRWFRKRREAKFETAAEEGAAPIGVTHVGEDLPPLQLRVWRAASEGSTPQSADLPLPPSDRFRAAA